MEVVLLENIKNHGQIGDIVKVRRGHGRNFLIKYGKALKASKENIDLVNKKKSELNKKNLELKKSAKRIYEEIKTLNQEFNIEFFRCQDTNFLTIDRKMLEELSELINKSGLEIFLYIETRPEGINKLSIELLKKLRVDGVGMGIEVSSESFRKDHLNRFPAQKKIIDAFSLLKNAGIKRTSYNIIGLPNETEDMIIDTIKFNTILEPDNITVAFFSPYLGTNLHEESKNIGDFNDYEYNVDNQLRTVTKSSMIDNF